MDDKTLTSILIERISGRGITEIAEILNLDKKDVRYAVYNKLKNILMGLYVDKKISNYKGNIKLIENIPEDLKALKKKYNPQKTKKEKKLPEHSISVHIKLLGSPMVVSEFPKMVQNYIKKLEHLDLVRKSTFKMREINKW